MCINYAKIVIIMLLDKYYYVTFSIIILINMNIIDLQIFHNFAQHI